LDLRRYGGTSEELKRTFEPSAVPHPRNLNRYLANPGHHLAFRQKPVPYQPLAAFIVQKIGVRRDELGNLRTHRRCQKLTRALAQHIRQRIR
jgi:hypothetical protein